MSRRELVAALDDAAALLEAQGAARWATWMCTSAAEIRAGGDHGVRRVLSAYGGSGSFEDLVVRDPRLGVLRTRIHLLASALTPAR